MKLNDAFWRWFRDSKVVDEDGNPLVVYKAMYPYDWTTKPEQEIVSINRKSLFPASHGDEPGFKIAGFFGDKETANTFARIFRGAAIFPCYLSLLYPTDRHAGRFQFGGTGIAFRNAMRSNEYDGAIIYDTEDENTIYVAKRPNQIKSALANDGSWSIESDDIRSNPDHVTVYHGGTLKGSLKSGIFVSTNKTYAKKFATQTGGEVFELDLLTDIKVYPEAFWWQDFENIWHPDQMFKGYDAVLIIEPNGEDESLVVLNVKKLKERP